MSFNKLTAYTQKVADAADQLTGNPADNKAIFDAAPEEIRSYFNNLVDALKSTASGDSGAKNTGATAISGLTGTDIQSLLESLKSYSDTTFAPKSNPFFYTRQGSAVNYGTANAIQQLPIISSNTTQINDCTIGTNEIVFHTAGVYEIEGIIDYSGLNDGQSAELLIRFVQPDNSYSDDTLMVTGGTGIGENTNHVIVTNTRILTAVVNSKVQFFARCSEAPRTINGFWLKGKKISG